MPMITWHGYPLQFSKHNDGIYECPVCHHKSLVFKDLSSLCIFPFPNTSLSIHFLFISYDLQWEFHCEMVWYPHTTRCVPLRLIQLFWRMASLCFLFHYAYNMHFSRVRGTLFSNSICTWNIVSRYTIWHCQQYNCFSYFPSRSHK